MTDERLVTRAWLPYVDRKKYLTYASIQKNVFRNCSASYQVRVPLRWLACSRYARTIILSRSVNLCPLLTCSGQTFAVISTDYVCLPTEHFTISEPQNLRITEFPVVDKRQLGHLRH